MMKWLLPAAAAAVTLAGGVASAQPYGYYGGRSYGYDDYGYGRSYDRRGYYRDSDRDGIPDRVEWGRDRDHDGRPDQWDRYDNRRRHHHRGYEYRRAVPYYGYGYDYGYSYGYRY